MRIDEAETATEEVALPTKARKPRKAAASAAKAKKAKRKVKAKVSGKVPAKRGPKPKAKPRGNGEDRKDTIAAMLGIHANSERSKLVEFLASKSGKMLPAETIAKHVGWDRKIVQGFITGRIPYKIERYKLERKLKLLTDGEGNYGLEVK